MMTKRVQLNLIRHVKAIRDTANLEDNGNRYSVLYNSFKIVPRFLKIIYDPVSDLDSNM